MTPEQVLEKMCSIYGEGNFADPEHYPKVFKHQLELAKWILSLESKKDSVSQDTKQEEKSSLDPEPEV